MRLFEDIDKLHKDCRLYLWLERKEVVFFQSIIEAYEGLARVRTERHLGSSSLIVVLYSSTREDEVYHAVRHLQEYCYWKRFDS